MQACELRIEADQEGQRLDRALQALCPEMSLRARRRLIETGQVLLNGQRTICARKVHRKDVIGLCLTQDAPKSCARFLKQQGEMLFFFKPRGLNTAKLAGSPSPSLEAQLPALCPCEQNIRLVQRLDCGTSGIVSAVSSSQALSDFRKAEDKGLVLKKYFALLEGKLDSACRASMALDTDNCERTKLQDSEAPWSRRTTFVPLAYLSFGSLLPAWLGLSWSKIPCDLTLAGCSIHRGARHQIRAHAAALGHPLFGDSLYGGSEHSSFFLHQAQVTLPFAQCLCLPDWLVEEALPATFWDWLA